jgi:rhomboid protease GluP
MKIRVSTQPSVRPPPSSGPAEVRDPEVRAPPPAPRLPLRQRLRAAPATTAILAINVAVFAASVLFLKPGGWQTALEYGASERHVIWAGQYWRFVTPMFLHVGPIHLAWNTVMMFGLCATVESVFRARRFVLMYLASGIGATAVSLLCDGRPSAGASGAAFGMIGVVLVLIRRTLPSWSAFFRERGVRAQLVYMALWMVLGSTALRMDNYAHVGGLVWGGIFAWVLTVGQRVSPARRLAGIATATAMLALTVVAAARPWAVLGMG